MRDGIEFRPNGGDAALFYRAFIHACGVEVANFLSDGIAIAAGLGGLVEHAAEESQIVLIELAVDRPGSLIGRDGIFLLPASTGIGIKIHARVDQFVHGIKTTTEAY